MADKNDLREVVREELERLLGDKAGVSGPDISGARIRRDTDGKIVSLGWLAGAVDQLVRRKG